MARHDSSTRQPIEHAMKEPFDLQDHVMSMAAALPFYWPKYNAEMTQQILQDDDIEDGTYILRPCGVLDRERKRFLTLSVRMDFPQEPTKVWHFPVIIAVVENGENNPSVYFSLTQARGATGNQITSLQGLLDYHHNRPLKGGKLPHICKVVKGLPYQGNSRLRETDGKKAPALGAYEMNVIESTLDDIAKPSRPTIAISDLPPTPERDSPTLPDSAVSSSERTLHASQSQRERRAPSPQPPPRFKTLPRTNKGPQPAPRKEKTAPADISCESRELAAPPLPEVPSLPDPPKLPERKHKPANHLDHGDRSSGTSTGSGESATLDRPLPTTSGETKFCQCGLPLEVTYLPKFWTVHRSTAPDTVDMLYFRNPAGQTAWALPPYIDQECKNRDYLSYGRLNVSCFQQYEVELNYSASSELSNWSEYSTYDRRK